MTFFLVGGIFPEKSLFFISKYPKFATRNLYFYTRKIRNADGKRFVFQEDSGLHSWQKMWGG